MKGTDIKRLYINLRKDTIDELLYAVEEVFTNAELQRLLLRFSIVGWESETTTPKMIVKSIPYIHSRLNGTNEMGVFTEYILTFINNRRNKNSYSKSLSLYELYPLLSNTLLRDGYKAENFELSRTIPRELENANIPDELISNLNFFNLNVALGHLEQAQANYKIGNWASANAMIRTCFESVLIFINGKINVNNPSNLGGDAIVKLTKSGFFRQDLNEADDQKQAYGFIGGLYKMLHPHGPHPGLSEEEDSTFRYHVTLVALNYYLKRLKKVI